MFGYRCSDTPSGETLMQWMFLNSQKDTNTMVVMDDVDTVLPTRQAEKQ